MINIPSIDEDMVKFLSTHKNRKQLAQMVVDLNNENMRLKSDLELLRYMNLKLYTTLGEEVDKTTP